MDMSNGKLPEDFNHYTATMYRTKKNNLFVYEEGGAYSKMGISLEGNASGGSHDLKAISETEAVELIQEWHLDGYISVSECQTALTELGIKLEEA